MLEMTRERSDGRSPSLTFWSNREGEGVEYGDKTPGHDLGGLNKDPSSFGGSQ